MKIKKQNSPKKALAFALALTLFAPRLMAGAGTAIDPDADRIFRASCKYLADAKGFCVKVEVWRDVVLPTGEVLTLRKRQSSGHAAYDDAVERAIMKSSPLPLPDDRAVFRRDLELKFRPQDR